MQEITTAGVKVKMSKFWRFKTVKNKIDEENESTENVLFLNGVIAEESWYSDDVTPKMFRDELNHCILVILGSSRINTLRIHIREAGTDRVISAAVRPESVKLLMFPYVGTIPVIGIIGYLNLETKLAGIIRYDSAEEKLFIVRVG